MKEPSTPPLSFEIPVPWSKEPIRITTSTTVASLLIVGAGILFWFGYFAG